MKIVLRFAVQGLQRAEKLPWNDRTANDRKKSVAERRLSAPDQQRSYRGTRDLLAWKISPPADLWVRQTIRDHTKAMGWLTIP